VKSFMNLEAGSQITLLFESFGFKHGIPVDADLVFDVRCLPNPHYDPVLRPLTGRDQPVIDFLERVPEVGRMVGDIYAFVASWLPSYVNDNRSYLTVAIGCTGGQHRSVYIAEQAERFRDSARVWCGTAPSSEPRAALRAWLAAWARPEGATCWCWPGGGCASPRRWPVAGRAARQGRHQGRRQGLSEVDLTRRASSRCRGRWAAPASRSSPAAPGWRPTPGRASIACARAGWRRRGGGHLRAQSGQPRPGRAERRL
jgi:hypothetical protein